MKRVSNKIRQLDVLKASSQCFWSAQIFTLFIDSYVMVILIPHCLSSSSWFQVKRACGQARWADKGDHDGDTSAGHHHGDTLASGQQEILSGTITQGHISTGQSQSVVRNVSDAFYWCFVVRRSLKGCGITLLKITFVLVHRAQTTVRHISEDISLH